MTLITYGRSWYTIERKTKCPFAYLWCKIGVILYDVKQLKNHAMALDFVLQMDKFRSFKWGTVYPCRSRDLKNTRG